MGCRKTHSGRVLVHKTSWRSEISALTRRHFLRNLSLTLTGTPLCNLKSGRAECDNRTDRRPEVVKELTDLLDKVKTEGRSRP